MCRMQSMTEHNQQKLEPETEAEGLEIEIEGKVLESGESKMC